MQMYHEGNHESNPNVINSISNSSDITESSQKNTQVDITNDYSKRTQIEQYHRNTANTENSQDN